MDAPDLFSFIERGHAAQAAVDHELAAGHAAAQRSAGRHRAEIQALVPLVRFLVDRSADGTVTVTELREAAVARNMLPRQGALDWLGAVFRAAGLVTTGERRRHGTAGTHGKWVAVWRRP